MPMSSRQASLRARIAAHRLHSTHDSREITALARAASAEELDARLLAEIDASCPGLLPEERAKRLHHARRAHFAQLALASVRARKGVRR